MRSARWFGLLGIYWNKKPRAVIVLLHTCAGISEREEMLSKRLVFWSYVVLSGSEDSWTPAELCAQYVERLQPQHEIMLKVFASSHHAFDHPGIDTTDGPYIVRSNPKVAAQDSQMSREFLEERL